jgi:hypothetical protein
MYDRPGVITRIVTKIVQSTLPALVLSPHHGRSRGACHS